MNKFKRTWARFLWNKPVLKILLALMSFAIGLFFALHFLLDAFQAKNFIATIIYGVISILGFFFYVVLLKSRDWTINLPEYVISEAQKILESKIVSLKLEALIEQAKTSKGEDGLNELKNWLKLFEDYKSLKENLPQLQKQQDEIATKISESMEKRNQLRMDLLIS